MSIFLAFLGVIGLFVGLDMAFSEKFTEKTREKAPLLMVLGIAMFCFGIILYNQGGSSGVTTLSSESFKIGDTKIKIPQSDGSQDGAKSNGKQENQQPSGMLGGVGAAGEQYSAPENSIFSSNKEEDRDKPQKPLGWANGLGGTFEKWKALFGAPSGVELVDQSGKATFQDGFLEANFYKGKVIGFTINLQKIDSDGFDMERTKKEVEQLIPPDSQKIDEGSISGIKGISELYRSNIMKKDMEELGTDYIKLVGQDNQNVFRVNYLQLGTGNVYSVDVKVGKNGE